MDADALQQQGISIHNADSQSIVYIYIYIYGPLHNGSCSYGILWYYISVVVKAIHIFIISMARVGYCGKMLNIWIYGKRIGTHITHLAWQLHMCQQLCTWLSFYTENWELSQRQLCHHRQHEHLPLLPPLLLPVVTKVALQQLKFVLQCLGNLSLPVIIFHMVSEYDIIVWISMDTVHVELSYFHNTVLIAYNGFLHFIFVALIFIIEFSRYILIMKLSITWKTMFFWWFQLCHYWWHSLL